MTKQNERSLFLLAAWVASLFVLAIGLFFVATANAATVPPGCATLNDAVEKLQTMSDYERHRVLSRDEVSRVMAWGHVKHPGNGYTYDTIMLVTTKDGTLLAFVGHNRVVCHFFIVPVEVVPELREVIKGSRS